MSWNFSSKNLWKRSHTFTVRERHRGPLEKLQIWLVFLHITDLITLLTHWSRVTHICVSKQTIIGSDNGLSPGQRQAIILTNAGIVSIGPLGTNFNEISIRIHIFSFKKIHLKMSSAEWRPFCLGLNVLKTTGACMTRFNWCVAQW